MQSVCAMLNFADAASSGLLAMLIFADVAAAPAMTRSTVCSLKILWVEAKAGQ